jgi:uncharacterized protein DUF4917
VPNDPPDGRLCAWDEIADRQRWEVLLLGNGLSVNVWDGFDYNRLVDHAGLSPGDRAMFDGRVNFERVLADLSTAIGVNEVEGIDAEPLYERYRSIQHALGRAVRQVHPDQRDIPPAAFRTIRSTLAACEWIFTTSYDLLLYWSIGHGGTYKPFKDHFRYGGRCEFDPARANVYAEDIPVYYLHGALHLVVGGSGTTWKLSSTALRRVLDQFGEPIAGDPQARPLLVTEGSSVEKREVIDSNEYLRHALGCLEQADAATVVFGSRLGEEDEHLVKALSASARPIAISMRPDRSRRERTQAQVELWARLGTDELYFFDAGTHPLGSAALKARSAICPAAIRG